jgi:hypothetical protein
MYDLYRLNKRIGGNNMSSKKKKPTNTVSAEPVEQIDPTPPEDVPTIQLDEAPVETKTETEPVIETAPTVEPVAVTEPQPIVEIVAEPAPIVEPVVEVKPPPVVEPTPASVPPSKPKPLTMLSLHSELEELRQVVDQQAILIKQLIETPARQRKPPTSNGKVQIKDTLTGKIYPSKNNVYQSLLKAGELDALVKQGVFGSDPAHNSFGCYNLFRFYKDRFIIEQKPQETNVA